MLAPLLVANSRERSYIWGQLTKIIQTPDDRKRVSLSEDSRDFRRERDEKSLIEIVKVRISNWENIIYRTLFTRFLK